MSGRYSVLLLVAVAVGRFRRSLVWPLVVAVMAASLVVLLLPLAILMRCLACAILGTSQEHL
jgi:hypothetical protein